MSMRAVVTADTRNEYSQSRYSEHVLSMVQAGRGGIRLRHGDRARCMRVLESAETSAAAPRALLAICDRSDPNPGTAVAIVVRRDLMSEMTPANADLHGLVFAAIKAQAGVLRII